MRLAIDKCLPEILACLGVLWLAYLTFRNSMLAYYGWFLDFIAKDEVEHWTKAEVRELLIASSLSLRDGVLLQVFPIAIVAAGVIWRFIIICRGSFLKDNDL